MHDWRSAYLTQARSDFQMFRLLEREGAPLSHCLHYLQMATEKLSKGLKLKPGEAPRETVQEAFVSFLKAAQGMPSVRAVNGFDSSRRYRSFLMSLQPYAQQIQDLTPRGGEAGLRHVNPEYPWETNGIVMVPAEYPFPGYDLNRHHMARLLSFVEHCFLLA